MLCFRVGCERAGDGAGSVRLSISVGTSGTIGISEAIVTLPFCSLACAAQFCAECEFSQKKILEAVEALENGSRKQDDKVTPRCGRGYG